MIKSNIAKKYWMALTGLFLCIFLIGHLYGNLPLLVPHLMELLGDGNVSPADLAAIQLNFNDYAKFMTTTPAIKILSYLTYLSIVLHSIDGLVITIKNKKARNAGYAYNKPGANSIWSSRNMGVLGTIILVYIIIHMGNFWVEYHWGALPPDAEGNKDLFSYVVKEFKQGWYVGLYVVSMIAIGFHLFHGFRSAFTSMGWRHPKYTPFIQQFGYAFAIIISAAFAVIPVYVYFMY